MKRAYKQNRPSGGLSSRNYHVFLAYDFTMRLIVVLISAVALGACQPLASSRSTPPAVESSLHGEIRGMDDSMTVAFNAHDADALMSLFASDVEFYHDIQGVQDYQAVSAGFRGLFARGSDIRRERIGTLEVYPIQGYGAIEVGAHRFCHTEGTRQNCGTFKFMQVWRRGSSGWKIARVVSYGH